MNPPTRPIRVELNDAIVGGIRQRGADAVGLVIMGIAYLVISVLALLVLLFASSVFGIDRTALPVTIMTLISAGISWLVGKSIRPLLESSGGQGGASAGQQLSKEEDGDG
jgi:hypothetical protein